MPDRMVEDARNVTINLHGEHGKFVMIQLFFSDKWMLISEITFTSSKSFFLSPLGVFSSFLCMTKRDIKNCLISINKYKYLELGNLNIYLI